MSASKKDKLISVDELIQRAQERGVDFGDTKPRNRLRYYAKLDLIPGAQRAVLGDSKLPTGAYPEWVADLLVEINEKVQSGKSIKEVAATMDSPQSWLEQKRSKGEEKEQDLPRKKEQKEPEQSEGSERQEKGFGLQYGGPFISFVPGYKKSSAKEGLTRAQGKKEKQKKKSPGLKEKKGKKSPQGKSFEAYFSRWSVHITSALIIFFLLASLGFSFYQLAGPDFSFRSRAAFWDFIWGSREQAKTPIQDSGGDGPGTTSVPGEYSFWTFSASPYLTFNVETDINAPLHLGGADPGLFFEQGANSGRLEAAPLSADRSYRLPDASGTICLDSGNCESLTESGAVITEPEEDRLAKIIGENELAPASISDLYEQGALLYLSPEGNVGVGVEDPESRFAVDGDSRLGGDLQLGGRMEAEGDICTELDGGVCLSEIEEGGVTFIGGGGGGGEVDGSGSSGYLARWTSSDEISDSALYQSGSNIGIGDTGPSSKLDVDGTVTMTGFKMPTNATSGYVLTAATSGVGTWQELSVFPSATTGETLYYDGNEWATSSLLTNTGSAIGIGTTSPDSKLTVVGTTTSIGNLLVDNESSLLADSSSIDSSAVVFRGYYDATTSTSTINATSTQFILKNIVDYASGSGRSRLGFLNDAGSEIMSLDSNTQRIGMGTTSPNSLLSVAGAVDITGTTTLNNTAYRWPTNATSGHILQYDSGGQLTWVNASGSNVGQWTDVGPYLYPDDNDGQQSLVLGDTTTSTALIFLNQSGDSWFNAGGVSIGTTTSDGSLHVADGFLTVNDGLHVTGKGSLDKGIVFSDEDSGLYEASDDVLQLQIGGVDRWNFSGDTIESLSSGGNFLAGSSTDSSIVHYSFAGDSDTGVSRSGSDKLSFVTGGTKRMEIDENGNIGIGTDSTTTALDVSGAVEMEGFKMATGASSDYVLTADNNGVGTWQPSDAASALPAATSGNTLYYDGSEWATSSLLSNIGSAVGIGTTSPSKTLSIDGGLEVTGSTTLNGVTYNWPSADGSNNQVLETDGAGNLGWADIEGTSDADWYIEGSKMYATSGVDYVGIGTTSPSASLAVAGDTHLAGPLRVATSSLPQFVIESGSESLQFSLNATTSEITASGHLVVDSSTGEVRTGENVGLVDAGAATVEASTFVASDATIRQADEALLRASTPVFSYSMPVQTNSSSFRQVSTEFSSSDSLASTLPDRVSETTRRYAFLINFADGIPASASSTWRIYRPDAGTTFDTFSFSGQELSSLEKGKPHLSDFYNLPDNDWRLEVKSSSGDDLRVFNVMLLTYDQVD